MSSRSVACLLCFPLCNGHKQDTKLPTEHLPTSLSQHFVLALGVKEWCNRLPAGITFLTHVDSGFAYTSRIEHPADLFAKKGILHNGDSSSAKYEPSRHERYPLSHMDFAVAFWYTVYILHIIYIYIDILYFDNTNTSTKNNKNSAGV